MSTAPQAVGTEVFRTRSTCRACGNSNLEGVLDLGVQYLPRWVKEKDESLPKAPLHLIRCATCGLLQLEHTVDPDVVTEIRLRAFNNLNMLLQSLLSGGWIFFLLPPPPHPPGLAEKK